tara:strand:- start:237 stop:1643 length:1407 start_codon:yes stop_codon:yes gene_type:complete
MPRQGSREWNRQQNQRRHREAQSTIHASEVLPTEPIVIEATECNTDDLEEQIRNKITQINQLKENTKKFKKEIKKLKKLVAEMYKDLENYNYTEMVDDENVSFNFDYDTRFYQVFDVPEENRLKIQPKTMKNKIEIMAYIKYLEAIITTSDPCLKIMGSVFPIKSDNKDINGITKYLNKVSDTPVTFSFPTYYKHFYLKAIRETKPVAGDSIHSIVNSSKTTDIATCNFTMCIGERYSQIWGSGDKNSFGRVWGGGDWATLPITRQEEEDAFDAEFEFKGTEDDIYVEGVPYHRKLEDGKIEVFNEDDMLVGEWNVETMKIMFDECWDEIHKEYVKDHAAAELAGINMGLTEHIDDDYWKIIYDSLMKEAHNEFIEEVVKNIKKISKENIALEEKDKSITEQFFAYRVVFINKMTEKLIENSDAPITIGELPLKVKKFVTMWTDHTLTKSLLAKKMIEFSDLIMSFSD